jgi:hypothetical protein
MARPTLFGSLSAEDLDSEIGGVGEAPAIDVEDALEGDEAADEAAEITAEIQQDQASMEDAMEVAEELEEKVEENEALLEKPEEITETAVVVAQESLKTAMRLLGAPSDMITVPSMEAVKENPASSLRLSNESMKEFVVKIAETIKAIFAKIINSIKKLWTKLVVVTNRSTKLAVAMRAGLKNYDDKDAKFDEAAVKAAIGKIGVVAFANGGSLEGGAIVTAINEYLKETTDVAAVKKYATSLAGMHKDIEGFITSGKAITEQGLVDSLIGVFKPNGKLASVLGEHIAKGVKDLAALPVKFNGTSIKYIKFSGFDSLKTLSIGTGSYSLSKEEQAGLKIGCASAKDVAIILNGVKKASDSSKGYADEAIKLLNTETSFIDTVAKKGFSSDDAELRIAVTKSLNACKTIATTAALDGILGQVAATKDVLGYCGVCMKAYTKKGAKAA